MLSVKFEIIIRSVVQEKNNSDSDNVVLLLSPLGERNGPSFSSLTQG